MRRFIISDVQLKNLEEEIRLIGDDLEPDLTDLWKAEAACMEIQIPAWATTIVCHGVDDNHDQRAEWIEVPK